MQKIIAAFDGLKYSESTRDFAIHLARSSNAHLIGVFMDDPFYTSYKIYDLVAKDGVSEARMKKFDADDQAVRATAAENFEYACRHAGLEYSVHHDRSLAIRELIHETIYADLLILAKEETLTHYDEEPPTRFVRDLLSEAQCPVLIVPEKYHPIEKVVLLYDGEPSSVHAIKMFSYLLPALKKLPTEVMSVNAVTNSLHLPDNKLMKELMKRHYISPTFSVETGWPEVEIVKKLKREQENTLVVLGAYRRSNVSRWFRQSMADLLMRELQLPLFIAHSK